MLFLGHLMSKLPGSCLAGMLLFILAPCCVIYGCGEWRVSQDVSAEPVAADLAQLEQGNDPADNHVLLGPHVACYYSGVYEYLTDRDHPKDPEPDTHVTSYYYPIVSTSDPSVREINRLIKEYGSLDEVPDDVPIPPIEDFRVLVKTDRFDDVKSLPTTPVVREEKLQGLVINRVASLDSDTKKYVRQSFPDIDFDTVLIVEEGRRPSSMLFARGVTFAATLAWLLGIVLCFVGLIQLIVRATSRPAPPPSAPQPSAPLAAQPLDAGGILTAESIPDAAQPSEAEPPQGPSAAPPIRRPPQP